MNQAKQSWQKFVAKVRITSFSKLNVLLLPVLLLIQGSKRFDSGITKGSKLFSTPEDATGKVGVVNSGKGMTEFETRKRHKFEPV